MGLLFWRLYRPVLFRSLLQECILLFEEGLASALDHGDHVYAAYHISQVVLYNLFTGTALQEVKEKAEVSQRALHRIGDTSQRAITTVVHHAARCPPQSTYEKEALLGCQNRLPDCA